MLTDQFRERPLTQVQAVRRLQRTQGAALLTFGAAGVRRWREEGAAKIRLPTRPLGAPAEAILINTAGGLTGGDSLGWTLEADDSALIVTTQAAEKTYRSVGGDAVVSAQLRATSGARLFWLPQETILFDGARLHRRIEADIDEGATLLALETVVFGREAMGESIADLYFHDRWRVRRDGRLIFADDIRIGGPLPHTTATLGDAGAIATLLLVSEDADAHLDELRSLFGSDGAVSAWDGKLVARMRARDGFDLRQRLIPALEKLVPEGTLPAIWSS
jgi:urease accessory protein